MLTKEEMLQMLHKNVVPAFGCTEPVCVALAAADAARAVGGTVESVHVLVSGNIYKNGMAVGIPNFNKIGIAYAAALGAYLANPEEELELLKEITPDIAEKATALAEGGQVTVDINKHQQGVYVKCEVRTSAGMGESEIAQSHANIISTKANGETVFEKAAGTKASDPLLEKLRIMKIAEIRALVDSCTEEELAFLLDGIDMNEDAARYSMHTAGVGVGIAATMQSEKSGILGEALLGRIMRRVASATEGRLDGCPYAVMSSAGSGSKGIAVIIPVAEAAAEQESKRLIYGVFDGMGGEERGEMASYLAAKAAFSTLRSGTPRQTLEAVCQNANLDICHFIEENGLGTCGTTAAMLLLTANGVSACNIGDSKIFRLSAGSLYQISEDHLSIAPYGEKAPLSQYLGIPPEELTICPYYAELPYADQDKYLLCSDGLTDMVPPEDIARILAKFPAEQAAQILLQNALDNGGKDNVTLIVLEIGRPAATGLLDRIRNLF